MKQITKPKTEISEDGAFVRLLRKQEPDIIG
jgi:hypothetical protein